MVAIADTGFDTGTPKEPHSAFTGRVKELLAVGRRKIDKTDDPHGHGTHVCGSVLGNGYSETMEGSIKGTTPNAQMIMQSLWTGNGLQTNNILELFTTAYERGAFIHKNSWGPDWNRTGGRQLLYDPNASTIDKFMFENPGFLILFAAGSDGEKAPWEDAQIGSFASSKNCLTVGATESSRPSIKNAFSPSKPELNDAMAVASFSSRGPTTQGRIKPDVMAPGTAILSARSRVAAMERRFGTSSDRNWMFYSGTSMATPLVAGCAAVLRQSLIDTARSTNPSAALIKAMLINGAIDLQGSHGSRHMGAAPDSIQGFGRIDLANSLIAPNVPTEGFMDGATLKQGPAEGGRRNGNMGMRDEFNNANNVERVVWQNSPSGAMQIFVLCQRTITLLFDQPYALAWKLVSNACQTTLCYWRKMQVFRRYHSLGLGNFMGFNICDLRANPTSYFAVTGPQRPSFVAFSHFVAQK